MVTDMTITGKPAQFGRGVIADVADKIIGQFAACVARKLAPAAEEAAPVAVSATAASEATSDIPTAPARRRPAPGGLGGRLGGDLGLGPGTGRRRTARRHRAPPRWRRPPRTWTRLRRRARRSPGGGDLGGGGARRGHEPAPTDPGHAAAGTSEAEAPATDMTPAAATGTPATPAGTSEVEAPAATDMAPDPATTTPASTARSAATAGGTGLRAHVRSEVDAIDLLDHAGAHVLQRLVPVVGGGLLLLLVVLLIRRLRKR